MAIKAPKTGGSKFKQQDPLEPGAYPARLVQVIELGVQKQRPYKGQEKLPKPELYTTYECVDEFMRDEDGEEMLDKPRWLSETFPMNALDSDLAKSTQRYCALDPELKYEGDWEQVVNTPCVINVIKKPGKGDNADKVYNNIDGVSTMREKEAAKCPALVNEPKVFDLDDPNLEVFMSLPSWLQDKIKENLNYEGSLLEKRLAEHEDGGEQAKTKKKEPAPEDNEADDGDDW